MKIIQAVWQIFQQKQIKSSQTLKIKSIAFEFWAQNPNAIKFLYWNRLLHWNGAGVAICYIPSEKQLMAGMKQPTTSLLFTVWILTALSVQWNESSDDMENVENKSIPNFWHNAQLIYHNIIFGSETIHTRII